MDGTRKKVAKGTENEEEEQRRVPCEADNACHLKLCSDFLCGVCTYEIPKFHHHCTRIWSR